MAKAKDNAIALYLEGIQNGHPREAVAAYTARFIGPDELSKALRRAFKPAS